MSHQTYARDCNWGFGADVRDLCAEIGNEDRDRWHKLWADSVLLDRVYLDVWKKCDGELEEQLGLMWACIHFM